MAGSPLGGLLGSGSVAQQFLLWGVLQQLAGAILTPVTQQILDETWQALPSVPITPAQAADLVLKGWWSMDDGAAEAKRSGINGDRFAQLVNDTGEPIALEQLLQAYRRNILQWDEGAGAGPSVMEGIRQSRVRNEWAATIEALRLQPIPVGEAVAAVVRHQITAELGATIAYYNGISSDDFTILVNTYGSPPGPSELIELVRRGIIGQDGTGPDVLTLQQGIAEGDTKDKWYPAYVKLLEYRPPPRTITALERAGSITQPQALQLYAEAGLSAQMAAAYSSDASATKVTKTKQLAEGQVLNLYKAKVIDATEAGTLLGDLGYNAVDVQWVLAWEDMSRELEALNLAIGKVRSLYVARKIGDTSAASALDNLGLPSEQKAELLRTWGLERDAVVHVLTAAEIADALFYQVMDQPTAQAALESLGYDAYDAWVILSLRAHSPLPDAPAPTGNVTGQVP